MRKKKVLVHGTPDTLKKFFADAISHDYEVVAILNEGLEKISITHAGKELEVIPSQNLPRFISYLADAVIITDSGAKEPFINFFHKQGFELRNIILWNEADGWESFESKSSDDKQVFFVGGLEFVIRDKGQGRFFEYNLNHFRRIHNRRNLDPELYPQELVNMYKRFRGFPPDLNNPKTFTEKLQWLKLYDATPLKSRLADKYLVRNWIEEKIGAQYLIPLLGVWDDFDDIDFNELPDQFVLKCNHGSAMNVIVRDKKAFDKYKSFAREKINAWLNINHAAFNFELQYTRINHKIIAEKFMKDGDAPDIGNYRFWCFGGKPIFCGVDDGNLADLRIDYFDMNWKPNGFENANHPNSEHPEQIQPPKNFELMKELAAKLAEGFAFVRVDLYEIEGRVYFGEMTFVPGAGFFYYKSKGTDEYLGSLLKLPDATPPTVEVYGQREQNPSLKPYGEGFFIVAVQAARD